MSAPFGDAEPGYQTTEFWATTITAVVATGINLAVAFGVQLTADQKVAVLAAIPPEITLLVAVYTVARSVRKRGTPG